MENTKKSSAFPSTQKRQATPSKSLIRELCESPHTIQFLRGVLFQGIASLKRIEVVRAANLKLITCSRKKFSWVAESLKEKRKK